MGQPPTYTRQYNFNDFATTSPSTPLPGDKVDAELNAAKLTLDELNANIAKIQRDDGKLGNTVVHKDAFDAGASSVARVQWLLMLRAVSLPLYLLYSLSHSIRPA